MGNDQEGGKYGILLRPSVSEITSFREWGTTLARRMTPRPVVRSLYCNMRHDRAIQEGKRDQRRSRDSFVEETMTTEGDER